MLHTLRKFWQRSGERVCVLSRGYGRVNPKHRVLVSDSKSIFVAPKEAGDEPYELAQKLIGKAYVIADADRVSAGSWAREKFKISAFVLDDAFQHQKVKRDLDIVTIDATNPFGNGKTLPFGILRERKSNLSRAGLIVITRANLSESTAQLTEKIRLENQDCPIILSENQTSQLVCISEINRSGKVSNEKNFPANIFDKGEKILAFCALGNPENFFTQLHSENYQVASKMTFADHHFYSQADISKIEQNAVELQAKALITTVKDAVKLKGLNFKLPCFVVKIELAFDDENKIRTMIQEAVLLNRSLI